MTGLRIPTFAALFAALNLAVILSIYSKYQILVLLRICTGMWFPVVLQATIAKSTSSTKCMFNTLSLF